MNQNTQDTPLEVLTPSALESIERASVDVQISTAHRFPRSLEQFKKRAMNMVQQDIETAESCIYSRPVGKGDDGKQKYAEGASIRMAEIVAACYGNIRVGARIIEQTERYVKAEGIAHDLESNYAAKSESMESTVKRNGTPYDERMRIVVAKAALSKALRDAVFRVVPKALCKSVYDAAVKVIAGQQKTIEQRRKMAQTWLASIRVSDERAFSALAVNGWSEVGEEQLLVLTGLKTGMKDNELTIDEAFPQVGSTVRQADTSDLGPQTTKPATQPTASATTAASTPEAGKVVPMVATPANASEGQPAGSTEALPPTDGVTCKYCGAKVQDIASHSCDQMKAELAKSQGQEVEQTPAEQAAREDAERKELLASIATVLEQNALTLPQLMKWTDKNKLLKAGQKLTDGSTNKLKTINRAIQNPATISEIKQIVVEK